MHKNQAWVPHSHMQVGNFMPSEAVLHVSLPISLCIYQKRKRRREKMICESWKQQGPLITLVEGRKEGRKKKKADLFFQWACIKGSCDVTVFFISMHRIYFYLILQCTACTFKLRISGIRLDKLRRACLATY